MSVDALQQVMFRVLTESKFRDSLFSNPDAALSGYELAAEERAALVGLSRDKFDAAASELESRLTKTGVMFTLIELNNPAVRGR